MANTGNTENDMITKVTARASRGHRPRRPPRHLDETRLNWANDATATTHRDTTNTHIER